MKIEPTRYGIASLLGSMLVWLVTVLTLSAFATSAPAAMPSAPPAAKPVEAPALTEDPWGRATPYGTVIGFLRAVDKDDYALAANYLDGKQTVKEKQDYARNLKVVLNRGVRIGLEDLSKVPEGRLDDGLSVYLEKVGTANYDGGSLDIILRRTTRADAPPVWLFSVETMRGAADAAERLDMAWGEAIWPESFRERRILSFPLFLVINLLISIPVMLGMAWLLNRVLLRLLRPLFVRHSQEHGESTLVQLKWLLFLLIFSFILQFLGGRAVTVASRIFFTSMATALTIVALAWLAVRITKLGARFKIIRLQQAGLPSRIAGVELFSWLLVCVFVIAGLFLILRSLGFEVTAAVAGLGVGGIAIAFAAQKTIENLFGTVMVITDEAIHVGDQCQAGNIEGRVESIGLRSTRIRTLDRSIVSVPNGQLATMSLGNLTHRDKHLFRHTLRLRYDTTVAQLREILEKIRKMMAEHSRLEPATVRTRLIRFGDAAFELEAFAYITTRDGDLFLEIQEELLLRIMDIIELSGTALALPAQAATSAAGLDVDAIAQRAAPRPGKPTAPSA